MSIDAASARTQFSISDVATVTHEGKVVVVGSGRDGVLRYTVRQSGFENSAIQPTSTPSMPGFEEWQVVPLNRSTRDPSVDAHERATLDTNEGLLTRSIYADDAAASSTGKVKLLSCLGHLYLFRVSTNNRLLLNRFILDGMANELVPKLEVRFHRSEQKLAPEGGFSGSGDAPLDTLAFRNTNQTPFFEPTQELAFLGRFEPDKPWFSVELMETEEHGKHRWNFFVFTDNKLRLVSVAASADGLIEPTDQRKVQQNPDKVDEKVTITIPGIIERVLELDGDVVEGFDSTTYHNQVARMTKSGEQLLKDGTRVMLAVPVASAGQEPAIAALSFTVSSLGLLAQIDRSGETRLVRGKPKDVLLPLNDLDEIKLIADRTPPPRGHIVEIGETASGTIRIGAGDAPDDDSPQMRAGQDVRLWGTDSYDGTYVARNVDEDAQTFEIDVEFATEQVAQGHWEVVDDGLGLAFENMIASYQPTADGRLRVTCVSHTISEGDEIKIEGTTSHDGVFAITDVGEDNSFTIDQPWAAGEVVNLSVRTRRGLVFDGMDDYLQAGPVKIEAHSPHKRLERTISVWVNLHSVTGELQTIFHSDSEVVGLSIDGRGHLVMETRFADGHRSKLVDRQPLEAGRWTHVSAMVDYEGETSGTTKLSLLRDGTEVASKEVPALKPLHLPIRNLRLNFDALPITTTNAEMAGTDQITVEAWINPVSTGRGVVASWNQNGTFTLAVNGTRSNRVVEWSTNGSVLAGQTHLKNNQWHHVAASFDPNTGERAVFVNGVLDATDQANSDEQVRALTVGLAAALGRPFTLGSLGAAAVEQPADGESAVLVSHGAGYWRMIDGSRWQEFTSNDEPIGEPFTEIRRERDGVRLSGATTEIMLNVGEQSAAHRFERNVTSDTGRWEQPINPPPPGEIQAFQWHHAEGVERLSRTHASGWRLNSGDGSIELYDEIQREDHRLWLRFRETVKGPDDPLAAIGGQIANAANDVADFFGGLFGGPSPSSTTDGPLRTGSPLADRIGEIDFGQTVVKIEDQAQGAVRGVSYRRNDRPTIETLSQLRDLGSDRRWELRDPRMRRWVERDGNGRQVGEPYFEVRQSEPWSLGLRQESGSHTLVLNTETQGWTIVEDLALIESYEDCAARALNYGFSNVDRFGGFLADVRVWRTARSESEVNATMHTALTGAEPGLSAFWPLGETGASQASDLTSTKAHLDLAPLDPWLSNSERLFADPWLPLPHRCPGKLEHQAHEGNASEFDETYTIGAELDLGRQHAAIMLGSGEHLTVPELSEDLSNGFTIAFWASWAHLEADGPVIDFGGEDGSDLRVGIVDRHLLFHHDGSELSVSADAISGWTHIAGAVDANGNATLYINGDAIASGTFAPPGIARYTQNYIGALGGPAGRTLEGSVRDVQLWGRALDKDDVVRHKNTDPRGTEADLLHYWSMEDLDSARAVDTGRGTLVHAANRGAFPDELPTSHNSQLTPITDFRGKLSDLEVWTVNPAPAEIRSRMYLPLSGTEYGLAHYWRCGGLLADPTPGAQTRLTPDLGPGGTDAVVTGHVFLSAVDLARRNSIGLAVRFSNDDLVAVTQGAQYVEEFEFRAVDFEGESWTVEDCNNADGADNKLFAFRFWGKSSRTSDDEIEFSSAAVRQSEFVDAGDGWIKASATITIPDNVNLVRVFEIDDVRGRATADDLPAEEWATLSVRRHRLALTSDSTTKASYVDELRHLDVLDDNGRTLEEHKRRLPALERSQAQKLSEIFDLTERLKAIGFLDLVRAELAEKQPIRQSLTEQIAAEDVKVEKFKADPLNHIVEIHCVGSSRALDLSTGDVRLVADSPGRPSTRFAIEPAGGGNVKIKVWNTNQHLAVRDRTQDVERSETRRALGFLWEIEPRRWTETVEIENEVFVADGMTDGYLWRLEAGDNGFLFHNVQERVTIASASVLPLVAIFADLFASLVIGVQPSGSPHERWALEPVGGGLRPEFYHQRLVEIEKRGNTLRRRLAKHDRRVQWLREVLAQASDSESLERRRDRIRTELNTVNASLNALNQAYLDMQSTASATSMSLVAEDPLGLKTYGSRLSFAAPASAVTTTATAEGNVQLSYFDRHGRMRFTMYDATSDSTNGTFEEWLGSGAETCVNLANPRATLSLESPVEMPGSGSTVEAWLFYPPPTAHIDEAQLDGQTSSADDQGKPYPLSFLTSNDRGDQAAIAIADGRRLGSVVDGFFHDCGVDLDAHLERGWHHVAARSENGVTSFFIDGDPVTSRFGGTPTSAKFRWKTQNDENPAYAIAAPGGFPISSTMSFQTWVRPTAPDFAMSLDLGVAKLAYTAMLSVGDQSVALLFGKPSFMGVTSSQQLPPDRWSNVAVTLANNVVTIYVNGAEVARGESTLSINAANAGFALATMPRPSGTAESANMRLATLRGDLSDTRVWSRKLAPDEVRDFMFTRPDPDDAGLVGHWDMSTIEVAGEPHLRDVRSRGAGQTARHLRLHTAPGDAPVHSIAATASDPVSVVGNSSTHGAPAGRVAKVRFWSAALADEEININAMMSLTGNEPDLVACFPLEHMNSDNRLPSLTGDNHATLDGGTIAARSAPIGAPGQPVAIFDGRQTAPRQSAIAVAGPQITSTFENSFTAEFWVKREGNDEEVYLSDPFNVNPLAYFHDGHVQMIRGDVATRVEIGEEGIHEWMHVACVYDAAAERQSVYLDGQLRGSDNSTPVAGTESLWLGAQANTSRTLAGLTGQLAEFRLWSRARSAAEIATHFDRRVAGDEADLVVALPLDDRFTTEPIVNLVSDGPQPSLPGGQVGSLLSSDLPIVPGPSLVTAEYSTVGTNPGQAGARRAMLRRFYCFADERGRVALLPGKRIEELVLKWIGNAQYEPTLLGYIEGAPPVPSENLTIDGDYDGATSVELMMSDEVEYSWARNTDIGGGLDINAFLGGAWNVSAGLVVESTVTEGQAGVRGSANTEWRREASTNVRARSTDTSRDELELRGSVEIDPKFPHLGNRYVPKNVGYALVVSGMADVFVTQMKRTGRMVAYEVQPCEDMPPDVNTITFLINPAYTLNGSLDGLVGSHAADDRFYRHVPQMRAQHGSRYPASYFDLKQAYALKSRIERWDKDREAYFAAFESEKVMGVGNGLVDGQIPAAGDDSSSSLAEIANTSEGSERGGEEDTRSDNERASDDKKALQQRFERDREKQEAESKKRVAEIEGRFGDSDKQEEATSAFKAWQRKMEGLQLRAAKRNIQNTYVWDADGGIRYEEESFANTIEHTIGGSFNLNASLGADISVGIGNFKGELQAMATLAMSQTLTKSASSTRSFELNVRLDRVERKGVTDANDYPVHPGEKVDRYRFMSFYLEGDTDHFHDFFNYVVDPEWYMSNDEEARALRQVARGKPNKAWRVLHRVTYVERPALLGFGTDARVGSDLADATEAVHNYFDDLEQDNQDLRAQINALSAELKKISAGLQSLGANVGAPAPSATADDPIDLRSGADDTSNAREPSGGLLDLNSATIEELEALNGVGPALAQAIINHREAQDDFESVDELVDISGIGAVLLRKLRPHLAEIRG